MKSLFSLLNKAVLFAALFLAITTITTTTFAADKNALDLTYAPYVNNFTTSNNGSVVSGLTGGTVQSTTSNNDPVGLVFTINLGINTSAPGDTQKQHWQNVQQSSDNNDFVIELCLNSDATKCWLSSVGFIPYPTGNSAGDKGIIYSQSSQSNYSDSESVPVNAFTTSVAAYGGNIFTYDPTTKTANSIGNIILAKGASMTASLWYCASGTGANAANDYKTNNIATNNPTTFGSNLCGGSSYFQIGTPLPITIPSTASVLQQQTASSQQALAAAPTVNSSEDSNLPACGITFIWKNGTISGCAAQIAYGIYWLTAWVAGLCGELFDFFIGYSVSSASYSYSFVVTGWKLVRDISNVFFIIIMVYTGFAAVFSTSSVSIKKVVPALIINALLINFSLFATRIVIDISNITARVFYNQMVVCKQTDLVNGVCPANKTTSGIGGFPSLSEKVVSAFDPQQMFKPSVLNPTTTDTTGTSSDAQNTAGQATKTQTAVPGAQQAAIYFGIMSLIAAALMIAIAIMFFKVAFLFLGRVVGLYICMIFAPFAFLSRDIPMLGSIERLNWKAWLGELTSYAMLAPIFIFFLYIIYTFLSSDFAQQIGVKAQAADGFFATVMSIAIPMGIIYFLMQAAQKTAEKYSGDIGKTIQKYGEQVTGLAVGAATGGAALIGSNTIGRGANALANNEKFKDWASRNGVVGRAALKSVSSVGKNTFDARNTTIGKGAAKQFGLNLDQKPLAFAGLDTKSTKGGYVQTQEDKVKAAEEYKKLLVTKKSDDEIKAGYTPEQLIERDKYDKRADEQLMKRWQEKVIKDARESKVAITPEMTSLGTWKKYKEGGKTKAAYEKAKDSYQKTTPPAIYTTAAEKNKARTNAYAEHKEKESGGAFATRDYYNKEQNLVAKKGDLLRNPYADDDLFDKDKNLIATKRSKIAEKNSKQFWIEVAKGAATYGTTGAVLGSVLPGAGTLVGGVGGTVLGAIKGAANYSGTTNKRIGGAARTTEKKPDKIIADALKDMGADEGATPPAAAATPPPPPPTSDEPPPTTP